MKRSALGIILSAIVGFILLVGCAIEPVRQVAPRESIDIRPGEKAQPIQFRRIVLKMPKGMRIGTTHIGAWCTPSGDFTWRGGKAELDKDEFTEVFRDELESANYVVVGDPESLFDDPSAWEAELLVGGIVRDMEANICFPWGQIGNWDTAKGEAFIKVEWQIYHRLGRKVVYKKMTEGSSRLPEPSPTGVSDLLLEAFAIATRNLLADQEFHDLVAKGSPVSPKPSFGELKIKKSVLFIDPIQQHISDVRIGVATVFAGDGHGSGFFVSSDGALLTNAHVVGGAKFVKVKMATGRELLGEVLRTDAVRDIALIRVEETNLIPLPIRITEANVGEEVYCIGSPLHEKFSTTMSRGIVSGYRVENEMKYLQSDVNVLPGSSGGPLLDRNGNVIGLTVGGVTLARVPAGLNFFIPINEALESLNVKLEPDRVQTEWGIATSGLMEPQAPKAPDKRVAHVPKEVKKPKIRRVNLRSTPVSVFDADIEKMTSKYNFFITGRNEEGDFVNDFVDNKDGTITDRATGLMWEKRGTSSSMYWRQAQRYVSSLNKRRFVNQSDWRIPTTEELASLLERDRNNKGLHIDPLFEGRQKACWSSDQDVVSQATSNGVVDFSNGSIGKRKASGIAGGEDTCFIRAVRSVQRGELKGMKTQERPLQTAYVGAETWELQLTGDTQGKLELFLEREEIVKDTYSVRGKLSGLVQDYHGGPLELRCKLEGKIESNIILADFTGYAAHVEIGSVFVTGTIRGAISKSKGLGNFSMKHSMGSSVGEWTMKQIKAYK